MSSCSALPRRSGSVQVVQGQETWARQRVRQLERWMSPTRPTRARCEREGVVISRQWTYGGQEECWRFLTILTSESNNSIELHKLWESDWLNLRVSDNWLSTLHHCNEAPGGHQLSPHTEKHPSSPARALQNYQNSFYYFQSRGLRLKTEDSILRRSITPLYLGERGIFLKLLSCFILSITIWDDLNNAFWNIFLPTKPSKFAQRKTDCS